MNNHYTKKLYYLEWRSQDTLWSDYRASMGDLTYAQYKLELMRKTEPHFKWRLTETTTTRKIIKTQED